MSYPVNLRKKPYNLTDAQVAWVEETLADMSVREKAGQLFCLNMVDEDASIPLKQLREMDIKPGGFMTRTMAAKQVQDNFRLMQEQADIPLLLAANIERGADGVCYEGTCFGTQMQVAATNDPEFARQNGYYCAKEGMACGANWNFGPILDIDTNFHNPITNTRVFSSDPQKVYDMTLAYIKGMRQAGMLVCIKHWPGDGQDERDQHMVTSTNSLTSEDRKKTYGRIYKAAIDEGAETLMSAHIKLPSWSRKLRPGIKDSEILPGSLAQELNGDLLKGELGFNGLIVTDATSMNGFMQAMARKDSVPGCIAAGCDMFLFTINLEEDFNFMLDGIRNGAITPERLDDAVRRILGMKALLNLPEKKSSGTLVPDASALADIGTEETLRAARACADNGITLVKDTQNALPLDAKKTLRVLLHVLGDVGGYHDPTKDHGVYFQKKLEAEGFAVTRFNIEDESMWYSKSSVTELQKTYDLILYFANIKTSGADTVARIRWEKPMAVNSTRFIHEIPTVFVSVDNPYHLMDAPAVKTYINAYTPTPIVIDSLIEKMMGRDTFRGVNPIDPTCGLWDAMF